MGGAGPTQGAERHTSALESSWTARPRLARALRLAIFVFPLLLSFSFSVAAGRIAPAEELGVNHWLWIVVVFLLANVVLLVLRRLTNRLIPLVALMKLTLVFPDNAPSRTRSALRASNSRTMLRELQRAEAKGETGGRNHGDYLVQLLREVNDHDRLTRGHSERVRAYSELIGVELGLGDDDLNKLRWAALLHDVGKLAVPAEILNKDGRPTDDEWKVLSEHPAAAVPLLAPLEGWLGDWLHAADQHHCRWDGKGYPSDLSGNDITLAGRIVAIADAYDVMTSARSYKKPLAPEVARQELTDCAGRQFDPNLVRVFLRIGLGRLQTVAGPLAWVTNLTGAARLPMPAANAVTTGAWSAGVAATGVVTFATGTILGAPAPEALPLEVPVVMAYDAVHVDTTGDVFEVILTADGANLGFSLGGAAHGNVVFSGRLEAVGELDDGGQSWEIPVAYTPDVGYVGEDAFSFEACDDTGQCDQATVTLELLGPEVSGPAPTTTTTTEAPTEAPTTAPPTTAPPTTAPPTTAPPTTLTPNDAPTANDDSVIVDEDDSVVIDVLGNDVDAEGDALSITGVGDPLHGVATIVGGTLRYTPDPDANGADQFSYTISDGANPSVVGTVRISIVPVNDRPTLVVVDAAMFESDAVGTLVTTVTGDDVDGDPLSFRLVDDGAGHFTIDATGALRVAAQVDREAAASYDLIVGLSDGSVEVTGTLRVAVDDVDEPPVAAADMATVAEDVTADIDVGANDADPEGRPLVWSVPAASAAGGALTEADGVVTYQPPSDFVGTDGFDYSLSDQTSGVPATAHVTITVTAVNDAPVALADGGSGYSTSEDVAFTTADVRMNDTDVDDDRATLSVVVTSGVSSGILRNNGDGTFDYTPNADTFGVDGFEYEAVDAAGLHSAPVSVTIQVVAVNDAPVAVADSVSVANGASVTTADVRANDTDADGDALTVFSVSDGASGTVVSNGDGTLTYHHDGSSTSSDSFTYTVRDPAGATSTATVSVTVSSVDYDGVGVGDNCPTVYNPSQLDSDGDGIGDACDPSPTSPSGASFGTTGTSLGAASSVGVTVADFDGDGDIDAACANDGAANTVMFDVFFGLIDSGQSLDSGNTKGVAVGDFDGDGSPDLVYANTGGSNSVWLNDGSGSFARVPQTLGSADSWAVATGDVDGDGDVDAVFANNGTANTVWLNDGTGTLTDSGQLLGNGPTKGVSVGDLDGDGDLDLVFSNDGAFDSVWFNDGAGGFTTSGQDFGIGRSHASALGDLDGDGDLDLVIAGDDQGDTVWRNDGSGIFAPIGGTIGLGHSRAVALGDLDGDGDLDIAFGDHSGPNSVWLNNGSAVFNDSGNRMGNGATEGIALADLDGDGDLGIISANSSDANRLHGNT